jgi:hypothetical protein
MSLEFGKTGLIFNVAYDRLFNNEKLGFRLIAGRSFGRYLNVSNAGGGVFCLFGNKAAVWEVGADLQYLSAILESDDQNPGLGLVYPDYTVKTVCPSLNAGTRRYRRNSVLRAGFSALLIDHQIVPGAYLSIGKTF